MASRALRATAADIRRTAGVRVVDIVADVATQAGIDAVLSAAERELGRVDILVTGATGDGTQLAELRAAGIDVMTVGLPARS